MWLLKCFLAHCYAVTRVFEVVTTMQLLKCSECSLVLYVAMLLLGCSRWLPGHFYAVAKLCFF